MRRKIHRGVSMSVAVILALAPMSGSVHADDRQQIAAAIGAEESRPTAPASSTTTPAAKPSSPTSKVAAPTKTDAADASTDSELSQAQIWLGVGVAAFLAAVGGGGGGGSPTTSE